MEELGVDMSGTEKAHFTKTKRKSRSVGPPEKRMRMDVDVPENRNRSVSRTPRNEQGVKDIAVSSCSLFKWLHLNFKYLYFFYKFQCTILINVIYFFLCSNIFY